MNIAVHAHIGPYRMNYAYVAIVLGVSCWTFVLIKPIGQLGNI